MNVKEVKMKFKKPFNICDILRKYSKEDKNLVKESLKQTCKIAERAGEKEALWLTNWSIER